MIEEDEQATDEGGFEDVEGDTPPVDEYRLATRHSVVGGES